MSYIPEDQDNPLSEVPLTSVDEVVNSMTNFDLFGDWSTQMDEDQATSPKRPVPETILQSAKEYFHTSSPSL